MDLTNQLGAWSGQSGDRHVWAINKIDLDGWPPHELDGDPIVEISAVHGNGLDELKAAIRTALLGRTEHTDEPTVTNVRHIQLLRTAGDVLAELRRTLEHGQPPEEFLLADLSRARTAFDELTGRRSPEDVLERIFERFCIGK